MFLMKKYNSLSNIYKIRNDWSPRNNGDELRRKHLTLVGINFRLFTRSRQRSFVFFFFFFFCPSSGLNWNHAFVLDFIFYYLTIDF